MKRDEKAPDYIALEIKDADGGLWGVVHATPREFKSGSVGFYGVGKISNPKNPVARYQFNMNFTLIGSKPE